MGAHNMGCLALAHFLRRHMENCDCAISILVCHLPQEIPNLLGVTQSMGCDFMFHAPPLLFFQNLTKIFEIPLWWKCQCLGSNAERKKPATTVGSGVFRVICLGRDCCKGTSNRCKTIQTLWLAAVIAILLPRTWQRDINTKVRVWAYQYHPLRMTILTYKAHAMSNTQSSGVNSELCDSIFSF